MGNAITIEKNEYLAEFEKELIEEKNTGDAKTVVETSSTYSTADATDYALEYALTPNSAYADYSLMGGDCTNFISQCLYAGGKSMHYGTAYDGNCWFYTTSTNRTSTWTGASQFRNYVLGQYSQLNMSQSDWSSVWHGDIIQILESGVAKHSLIITGVAYSSYGRSDLLVCAHSQNRKHVSLSQYYSGDKVYYHVN